MLGGKTSKTKSHTITVCIEEILYLNWVESWLQARREVIQGHQIEAQLQPHSKRRFVVHSENLLSSHR
jgi:hypothetical protein